MRNNRTSQTIDVNTSAVRGKPASSVNPGTDLKLARSDKVVTQFMQGVPAGGLIQRKPDPDQGVHEKNEGFREKVLEEAKSWVNKEFTSQEKIDEIRSRPTMYFEESVIEKGGSSFSGSHIETKKPFKNYTTCVEFSQMVFKRAAVSDNPKDMDRAIALAKMLPTLFNNYAKESAAEFSIDLLEKQMARFESKEEEVKKRVAKQESEVEAVEQEEITKANPERLHQQKIKVAKMRLRNIQSALDRLLALKKKQQERIDKKMDERTELQKKTTAWIKPSPGLAAGGPSPGDMILFGQVTAGYYSVAGQPAVKLQKSAFRHISILEKIEVIQKGVIEKWHTIDGGDTKGKRTAYYVRLTDRLVFQDKPMETRPEHRWEEKPSPQYSLLGWIDTAKLAAEGPPVAEAPSESK